MGQIITRVPRTSQPQGAVAIDRSNWLGRTITHCIPFNGINREIVTGAAVTFGAGGSTRPVATPRGSALSLRGTGSTTRASIPLDLSAYTKLSLSFWMYWDAFANDDALAMEFCPNAFTNSGFFLDPNSSSPAGVFQIALGSVGAANGGTFTRSSAAAWHHYVMLFDRTTGASLGCSVFVDGVVVSVTALAGNADVADNFANNSLYFLSRNNTALWGTGNLCNVVIRGQYLMSAYEAREEYLNPWQIFAPQVRRIWVPGAEAPASTNATSIITRVPWTSQPQSPVGIDWGNPITRELRFAVGATSDLFDASRKNTIQKVGAPVQVLTSKGKALSLNGTGLYLDAAVSDLPVNFTMAMWINITSQPTTHWAISRGTSGVSYDSYAFGIGLGGFGSGDQEKFSVAFRTSNAPGSYIVSCGVNGSTYIGSATGWFHIVGTHDGTTLSIYQDGVLRNTAAGNASGPYANSSKCFIGGKFGDVFYADSALVYATQDILMFGRCLSAAEVKSLYDKPRQIFAPQVRRIWVPGAEAGVSFLPAWARNLSYVIGAGAR